MMNIFYPLKHGFQFTNNKDVKKFYLGETFKI